MKIKVVGWTYYDCYDFQEGDGGWAVRMAVVDEIKKNGYLFSGWDHQESLYCAPVFNDGKMRRFSQRGFADIMAEAHGETGYMDYASYMFGLDPARCVKPKNHVTKHTVVAEKNLAETFTLEVDEQFFATVPNKNAYDVFGHKVTKRTIQLADLPELRYIDKGDTLVLTCNGQKATFLILGVDRGRNLSFDERVDFMSRMTYSQEADVRKKARQEFDAMPLFLTLYVRKRRKND